MARAKTQNSDENKFEHIERRLYLRRMAQENGKEFPDPTPHELSQSVPPLSLRDEMRRFITQEVSRVAEVQQMESFEEADDFSVGDDDDMITGYTVHTLTDEEGVALPNDLEGVDPTPEPPSAAQEAAEAATAGEEGEIDPQEIQRALRYLASLHQPEN